MATKTKQPETSLKIADAVRLVVKHAHDDSKWWQYVNLPFGWNPKNPDAAKINVER